MDKIKDRSHINFILNYSFKFKRCLIGKRINNNSLDNVNSLNNILWNIEISYNKQNIVFLLHFLTGTFYQNYSNVFGILNYENC